MTFACRAIAQGVSVVRLKGTLDMLEAHAVRDDIKAQIEEGQTRIVLDLTELEFMDSSGLAVLVTVLRAAQAVQGDVVLVGPTPAVRSLIELTRLHRVFEIFEDESTALEAIAG